MIEWIIAVAIGLLAYSAAKFLWWSMNDDAFFDGSYWPDEGNEEEKERVSKGDKQ